MGTDQVNAAENAKREATLRNRVLKTSISTAVLAVATMAASSAWATDGYFQHGFGARQKAMGGAGVADGRDATVLAINPAGLTTAGKSFEGAVSLFWPKRGYTGDGAGFPFAAAGTVDGNDTELFAIPNVAYSTPIGGGNYFGISMYGNGGLNTDYENAPNPSCAFVPMAPLPSGVFCGGDTGVNLNQAFIAVGLAHDFGGFSLGVSPIFALQQFEAKGLYVFAGLSSDPAHVTNNGTDTSIGGGVRVGFQANPIPTVRIGASWQSKIWMGKFGDYAGLFADGGDFDIPQTIQAGVSIDMTPNFTVNFDYRWINYESVNSVGNPFFPAPLGSADGPGFGWSNVNAYKVGGEYRLPGGGAIRAGYSHNNNPIGSDDVTLSLLAPGTITDHITGGFEFPLGAHQSIETAVMYAPKSTVAGPEITSMGPSGQTIELHLKEFEVTVGWKYRF